jgi:hypothetical protein
VLQWVNLEKDNAALEGYVARARRDYLEVECTVANPNPMEFQVRLVPHEPEAQYEPREIGRNIRFACVNDRGSETNAGGGRTRLSRRVYLPAAGGNVYRIEAKHKNKVVSSGKIVESRRKLFCQLMKMTDVPGSGDLDAAGLLAALKKELWRPGEKRFIDLEQVGGVADIPRVGVRFDQPSTFFEVAAEAYATRSLRPHDFVIAFVDQIAKPEDRGPATEEFPVTVPADGVAWEGTDLEIDLPHGLWLGFDAVDDMNKYWLADCKLHLVTGETVRPLTISRSKVEAIATDAMRRGVERCSRVKVRFDGDALGGVVRPVAGQLRVTLGYRTPFFLAGAEFYDMAVVAIAMREDWNPTSPIVRAWVLVHEVGHKLGMVADGTGNLPKGPDTVYGVPGKPYDPRHTGRHCHEGISWLGTIGWRPKDKKGPACVMFGAATLGDHNTPTTFCGNCSPVVRKLDLGSSASGLKIGLDTVRR